VAQRRYRIPDVCVYPLPEPDEQIFTQPPYICIEVLSPKDSFPRLQDRLDDYLAMGVPNIWVLDPPSRRGWSIVLEGHFEALDGVLRTKDGGVALTIADLLIVSRNPVRQYPPFQARVRAIENLDSLNTPRVCRAWDIRVENLTFETKAAFETLYHDSGWEQQSAIRCAIGAKPIRIGDQH